ncbi:MAG: AbrB family transcriptional regulator [Pseudonocardia sp.]|nr:AbrB family transcriptional regulator [Pseudonocardia sp.]
MCYVVAELAQSLGVPAPELLAGLLIGLALALSGRTNTALPCPLTRAGQALVGVVMGSYLTPEQLRAVAPLAAPFGLAPVATIALALGVAYALARWSPLPRADATLATIPGGSAAIVSSADDLGAGAGLVGFAQYLRVGLVALTAPAVAWAVAGGRTSSPAAPGSQLWPTLDHLVNRLVHQLGAGVLLVRKILMPLV